MYKLIAFDVDDTLAEINKPIKPSTIKLLQKLSKTGITLALATGKPASFASGFSRQVGLNIPVIIGENGLQVYFGGCFPPKNFISVGITEEQKVLLKKLQAETKAQEWAKNSFFQPNDYNVTLFYHPEDKERQKTIVDYFSKKIKEPEYSQFELFVHSDAAEVVVAGINKGHSLKAVCEKLNISLNEVIAVGNGSNDVPMFEVSGYSVGVNLKPNYQNKVDVLYSDIDEALEHIIQFVSSKELTA